ncbi:MAG TPA: carboxypeptidase regulatory-like domain-containing protein [Pyrinomonadaceae bacterium]|nr:carboxypeptidase regulatory-like domain-containing protein [Pyrinomonadaceae bacterium]
MKSRLLFILATVLFSAVALHAQTSRGTVSGNVTDPNGAVVAGAAVTLTNTETKVDRTTVTNEEGFYRFDAVDPGIYSVKFAAQGFGEVTKTNFPVLANQTADVGAQMAVGSQVVTIDVTSEGSALLQTESPVRGGNIESQRITELPIALRNPVALALTLPGVSSNRGGNGVATFSVNGARGRSNNFLIDGTENNDISVAGQGLQITNPDAVQEVSVQTSNFDAEFGRAGGAVVNVITKGGTNDYRGTLGYLLDSTRDDAVTSQQSLDPAVQLRGHPLPGTEQWFFGTFGGPIIKNRTFFFGAYQQQRQKSETQTRLTTPSAAGRATLRQAYAAGASRNVDLLLNTTQNAVADNSFFNVALGERPGCPAPCNVQFGSYIRSYPAFFRDNQFQIRIDHQLSKNNQLSGRYVYDGQLAPKGSDASFEGFDVDSVNRYQNFLIADTHVFSPSLTNELRLAYNRLLLNFPLNTDETGSTLPLISIAGVRARAGQAASGSFLGVASNLPQGRVANNYLIQETMTYLHGNHTFRFGGEFLRQISRQSAPFNLRGSLTYQAGGGFTGIRNFADDFGGNNGGATKDFGSPVYFPQLYRTAAFFQDRWQMTSSLTLTAGLRYEYFGTPFNSLRTPAFTGIFNLDPATRTGPFSQPNEVEPDRNNFGPAVGLAYSPSYTEGFLGRVFGDRQTVIRMGYQIGYDSFFNNIASNIQSSSPNIVSTQAVSVVNAANPRGTANLSAAFPATARPVDATDAQSLVSRNLVNPYFQRWSVGVQRSLPFNLILDMSYVGSKGTKLYIQEDFNPLVANPAQRVTPAGYVGPTTGRYDNIQGNRTVRGNSGSSSYNSGQFQLQRRFADNFTATAAYTWSKLIDNNSDVFATAIIQGGSANPNIPFIFGGLPAERAVSLLDRPHRAVFTYVYALPWFREQRGFIGHALGGWEVSGVTTFESGFPYTVTNGVDANGVGGAGPDRPDFNAAGVPGVRAVPVTDANNCITGYINPDAGGAPIDPANAQYIGLPTYIAGRTCSVQRTGNLGRNTARSPGTNQFNMNFLKRVNITENKKLEFRTEFYNIFNHPNYLQGSISPFSPGSGFLQQDVFNSSAGEFLKPNSSTTDGGGRVIRYQVKFIF